jgi:hypothetical protein
MDDLGFKHAVLSNWENARDNGYYDNGDFTWEDVAIDMIAFASDMEELLAEYDEDALIARIVAVLEHTD